MSYTKEEADAIIAAWDKKLESAINAACEKAFWQFDARCKGYAEWEGRPQTDRDAFKAECYMIAKRYILEPENDVSQTLANDLVVAEQQRDELLAKAKKFAQAYDEEAPLFDLYLELMQAIASVDSKT